ncbi:MAG: pilin, partial [Gammaproteobacteria bacterium]|nr:pilin [Gammaproteobacteria bacterium]
TLKAKYTTAYSEAQALQTQVAEYAVENQTWPKSFQELGFESETLNTQTTNYEIALYNSGTIGVKVGTDKQGEEQYIVLEPEVNDGVISWNCAGQNLDVQLLPTSCR